MDLAFEPVIVTSLVSYGDHDFVVRLFGPTRGRFGAFAKGARRSQRRHAGTLQALASGQASLRSRRGSALPALDFLDADARVLRLAQTPETLGRASYLAELVERLVPEGVAEPGLYQRLDLALDLLARSEGTAALLRAFELQLLADAGELPDLDAASDDPQETPVALDPSTGALLAHPGAGCLPFDAGTRRLAAALLQAPLDALPEATAAELRPVGRVFATHLRRLGGPPLRSVAFLRSLASVPVTSPPPRRAERAAGRPGPAESRSSLVGEELAPGPKLR